LADFTHLFGGVKGALELEPTWWPILQVRVAVENFFFPVTHHSGGLAIDIVIARKLLGNQ